MNILHAIVKVPFSSFLLALLLKIVLLLLFSSWLLATLLDLAIIRSRSILVDAER